MIVLWSVVVEVFAIGRVPLTEVPLYSLSKLQIFSFTCISMCFVKEESSNPSTRRKTFTCKQIAFFSAMIQEYSNTV